eukprot:GHVP01039197.1.p1 GENE.GHVP01039197.1~~GHVP01039197.1.p1  ORF type:complete len:691 (-),score=105.16 GHVP01039197.1:414-2486(-)
MDSLQKQHLHLKKHSQYSGSPLLLTNLRIYLKNMITWMGFLISLFPLYPNNFNLPVYKQIPPLKLMKSGEYKKLYKESIENNSDFWEKQAKDVLSWYKEFDTCFSGEMGSTKWFEGGMLNACYNCIDRHINENGNKVAIIYDLPGSNKTYTYNEAHKKIMKIAYFLESKGLKKGDVVGIYMAMCPEAVFATLACARLGLIHNVVFGGFSGESLAVRLRDSNAKFLIVQESSERQGKAVDFIEAAVYTISKYNVPVLVFDAGKEKSQKTIEKFGENTENISIWSKDCPKKEVSIPCVSMNSEDTLFYLYTSGSTGKPKGIIHTTAGYLCYAALTTKIAFNIQKSDVFACTADIGWITGHTYAIYGPLLNGITTLLLGETPFYPSPYRFFKLVEEHKVTQLYTAPTVIRMLMQYFKENPLQNTYNIESLRLLGSVGEPLNSEAYQWFTSSFNNLPIIDTYWQTESGGFLLAPVPSEREPIPECVDYPFLGQNVIIAGSLSTSDNVQEAKTNELGPILFSKPWPGMARGIIGNEERFKSAYFFYKGYYSTGDEGRKDNEGRIWVKGRSDDVINVSGHRISTAEVESTVCSVPGVSEAAVVGLPDDITGQGIYISVVYNGNGDAKKLIRGMLRNMIGKHINPKEIFIVSSIPKTATGKIMRRLIRDALLGKTPSDISTCINPDSVNELSGVSTG